MLFHKLKFSDLLSFGPAGIELPMEPLNVLIGPNGSGKSNLLEAISLFQAAPRGIMEPISRRGGVREWLWKGPEAPDSMTVDVEISFLPGPMSRAPSTIFRERTFLGSEVRSMADIPLGGTLRHCLTLADRDGKSAVAEEQVEPLETRPETHDETAYYRPPKDEKVAAALNAAVHEISKSGSVPGDPFPAFFHGRKGALEFAGSYKPDESLLSFFASPGFPALWYLKELYGGIRLYRNWSFGPNARLRQPCSAHVRSDFLDEGSENLPLVLSHLHGAHRQKLLEALHKLFDGIVDVRCPVTGGTVGLFLEEAGNRSIPATLLSDGTLRYLCLLAILLHPEPPPLICIEEPELGLHPDLLPTLSDLMQEASERTQLIVTTHSDVLVDALTDRPESVVVCEKHDGQTEMRRLDKDDLAKWLKDYRLGDLWTSGELGGNRW